MEQFLCGKMMATDEEMKETVINWLIGLLVDFDTEGSHAVQRLDKCLNRNSDYIGK
jgi:hypothetical protein